MRAMVMALLGWWAVQASVQAKAEVYRCEKDGNVTYTDRPCTIGTRPYALPPAIIAAPMTKPELELARKARERLARESSSRNRDDAEWVRKYTERKQHEGGVQAAILNHRVVNGMTANEVRSSLGEPDDVAVSESHGSAKETWTYRSTDGTRTVNFKNGTVSSSGSRSGRRKK